MTYLAKQNDTWDIISNSVYGTEYHVTDLMLSNPAYCSIVIFEGGEILTAPEIDDTKDTADWR